LDDAKPRVSLANPSRERKVWKSELGSFTKEAKEKNSGKKKKKTEKGKGKGATSPSRPGLLYGRQSSRGDTWERMTTTAQ